MKRLIILFIALLLSGCTAGARAAPVETIPSAAVVRQENLPDTAEETAATEMAQSPATGVVLQPEASGVLTECCDRGVIDYSHREEGYVMACFTADTEKRLKLRVRGPNTTYTYDLSPGQWGVFPLSDGDGEYQVILYENTTGKKYAAVLSAQFDVALQDEFAPFLRPNQYVDYSSAQETVAKGAALCTGLTAPLDKVAAVYDFVVGTLTYDEEKAQSVQSGYLPSLDQILREQKGICFDYAALMTAMLRSQQIPCKLVVGYAGSAYHAWISVWTEETGWIHGAIFFDGQSWNRMDPTFAAASDQNEEIRDFIENGSYTVKYLY